MSYSILKDNILKSLQDLVDQRTNNAVNMMPRFGDAAMAAMTTDEYAMQQINTLAEARALALAARIVNAEYNRLVEPEKSGEENKTQQAKPKENLYG